MVRLASLVTSLAVLTVLLWWLPNRPQAGDVPMPDARFNSVSFAPYRPGQSPLTGVFPTSAEVDQDLALIAGRTRAIRTYAAIEGDYDVAALARAHGLKLWQGIWLGGDRAQNAREIARAIAIANRYPDTVERVVVGNEVLLRRDLPPAELIADIDQVRAAVHQPVTYADVWEFWQQFPEIADHVDIVTIHILPYWEDQPTGVGNTVAHIEAIYRTMVARSAGKPVAIGETGWPSRGRWRQDAAPGRVNQVVFLRRFIALAQREGFDYNLIEAFDQEWKYQSEGVVGANWGIWTADRRPKFPLSGPVVEDPAWTLAAALAILLSLVLFAQPLACHALFPGPRFSDARFSDARFSDARFSGARFSGAPFSGAPFSGPPLRLALLAFAAGNALAYAWAGTAPVLYDLPSRLAAAGNLAGQAALALLLMHRGAAILAGAAPPPWRSGAQAADTVRDLLRLRFAALNTSPFSDLSFVFLWTAGVLQLLLVFDPRYRDFPLPTFAVPLVAVVARALLRDLPRHGGGREEFWAGLTLALGAVASAVREGPSNLQSLAWTAAAIVLAAPALLSCVARTRPSPRAPHPASPTSHYS